MRWLIIIFNWKSGAWLCGLGLLELLLPGLEGFRLTPFWPPAWLGWLFIFLGAVLIAGNLWLINRKQR
jgi:hypothetical protein